jgi:hypothetical protein
MTTHRNMSFFKPMLPVLAGTLGTLGVLGGIYNIVDPEKGSEAFGLLLPSSSSTTTTTSSSSGSTAEKATTPARSSPTETAFQQAYIRVHGLRDLATGLTTLGMVLYWQFSDVCQTSPLAALMLKRYLGVGFVVGSFVGYGDGMILSVFGTWEGVQGEHAELARNKGRAHAVLAVGITALGVALLAT